MFKVFGQGGNPNDTATVVTPAPGVVPISVTQVPQNASILETLVLRNETNTTPVRT